MNKKKKQFDEKMEDLATDLADTLRSGAITGRERCELFKHLNTYLIATRKLSIQTGEADDDGDSFGNFRKNIAASDSGGTGNPRDRSDDSKDDAGSPATPVTPTGAPN